jgi:hypothetical protein
MSEVRLVRAAEPEALEPARAAGVHLILERS